MKRTELRNVIQHERRIEFAFENQRWFDLLRTGTALQVMSTHAIRERSNKKHLGSGAYSNIHLLFNYPEREMNLQL
ncbi:RagB/SusD family nutrient uptake outer membrane protein [Pedobacter sp. NJ-S-72]